MSMSTLEKVRRLKARRPQNSGTGRMRGIFHAWEDGDNVVRLAGNFLEVRTHFVAPSPKRKSRGLCRADAFVKGEDSKDNLPKVINCPDWDIEKEEARSVKTCPICKLNAIARAILKEDPTDEERKFFEQLRSDTAPRMNLKWNIIDRKDPFVTVSEGEEEKRVKGFKVATLGTEAWKDIEGIFEQCGVDISDPKEGIDIKVIKGSNGTRVQYKAQAVLSGTNLKVTPFTPEEEAMPMHDLKNLCGRQVEADKILNALHEDLRELYDVNAEGAEAAPEPKEKPAPKVEKAPEAEETEDGEFDDGGLGDGDGLMDGSEQTQRAPVRKVGAVKKN